MMKGLKEATVLVTFWAVSLVAVFVMIAAINADHNIRCTNLSQQSYICAHE